MLGIDAMMMVYCAGFGGLIGGALCAFVNRESNKFNMRMLEDYWNSDVKYLKSKLEEHAQKISTFSVNNPVVKTQEPDKEPSYSRVRQD